MSSREGRRPTVTSSRMDQSDSTLLAEQPIRGHPAGWATNQRPTIWGRNPKSRLDDAMFCGTWRDRAARNDLIWQSMQKLFVVDIGYYAIFYTIHSEVFTTEQSCAVQSTVLHYMWQSIFVKANSLFQQESSIISDNCSVDDVFTQQWSFIHGTLYIITQYFHKPFIECNRNKILDTRIHDARITSHVWTGLG